LHKALKEENKMANQTQVEILKKGVDVWNQWRKDNPREEIDLQKADFYGASLNGVDLSNANLQEVFFERSDLSLSDLRGANLSRGNLMFSSLYNADLTSANLKHAMLFGADLTEADLTECNLVGSILGAATFLHTAVNGAKISGSWVYGVNVWDLKGDFAEQQNLVITQKDQPIITVDNIEVAQFIYLILNYKKIREVINSLTSKAVLILGRFSIPGRKDILDALRDKLREYDLLPIVFDFDRPLDKDFTETIKTLASLSYFVIADVTNPKSSPLELQATVPDYQIPFVPIIQEGERPFSMMVDLQKKYDWVLKTVSYDSQETLLRVLKPLIIDPAMEKRQELRLIKAHEPEVISGKEYVAKGI
jgi:hypothetical protein